MAKKREGLAVLPGLFLLTVLSGIFLQRLSGIESVSQWMFLLTLLTLCVLVVYWSKDGKMTEDRWIALLFLAAFAARLCYTGTITIRQNQHDVRYFNYPKANYGHTGYIEYLLENKHLPDFDVRGKFQFYHPPLHHILCALWLKVQEACGIVFAEAAENLQLLTLFYSMVALYASDRIFRLVGLRGKPRVFAFLLVAFHPTWFLLSGSINNDCLSVALVFCAVWAALEWHRSHKWYVIVALAFCIGGSMASKLATGVVAPAVALLFLYDLIKEKGAANKGKLVAQFALFGVICIPLGIGWQARNYLQYGVPLTYVPKLADNIDQYLGNYTVPQRLFDFRSLVDFGVFPSRTGTQGAEYFEHCIPLAALKTALFGEYSTWRDSGFFRLLGTVLFGVNGVVVLGAVASMFASGFDLLKACVRRETRAFSARWNTGRAPFALLGCYWVTMMISYVLFCFEYPHFCSMDYRYIVPTMLVGAVFFGKLLERLERSEARAARNVSAVLTTCAATFAVCSTCLYPLYFG